MGDINIYTDGSSSPIAGNGGWAFVLVDGKSVFKASGHLLYATSNIAEMAAALQAMQFLDPEKVAGKFVEVFTDSSYLAKGMNLWTRTWIRNDWRTLRAGKTPHNVRLWQALVEARQGMEVHFTHIPGHTGIKYNEMADGLAGQARLRKTGMSVNYNDVPDFVCYPFRPVSVPVEQIQPCNHLHDFLAGVGF